jgi:hypothetical protein
MGNWENIIKTDKYKFIYLPSFPFLFDKPVVSRRCGKRRVLATQSAAYLLDNLHYAEKSQSS